MSEEPDLPRGEDVDELSARLYQELRDLAARRMRRLAPGQTVQATALVHEVYLKLAGEERDDWQDQRAFFAAAARSMRNILVDRARAKGRLRRGGAALRISVEADELAAGGGAEPEPQELLSLSAAVDALERHDARKHEVVLLRTFAGLSVPEVAQALDVSPATVERDWAYAKAWLRRRMGQAEAPDDPRP